MLFLSPLPLHMILAKNPIQTEVVVMEAMEQEQGARSPLAGEGVNKQMPKWVKYLIILVWCYLLVIRVFQIHFSRGTTSAQHPMLQDLWVLQWLRPYHLHIHCNHSHPHTSHHLWPNPDLGIGNSLQPPVHSTLTTTMTFNFSTGLTQNRIPRMITKMQSAETGT